MRRIAIALALALSLAGCGPKTGAVTLLTGASTTCPFGWIDHIEGTLQPDAANGTAVKVQSGSFSLYHTPLNGPDAAMSGAVLSPPGTVVPVMWPVGFTGRWSGDQVEVLDPSGTLIATTGNDYELDLASVHGDAIQACGSVGKLGPSPS